MFSLPPCTAVNDLNYMTTNTYDVIEFTWSSFQVPCSANVFSLVCIRNGDSNTNVAVSEFSAVGVNVGFMCMYRYRQYGFQYNSVYECMLETSDMDLNDNVTVTTLPPGKGAYTKACMGSGIFVKESLNKDALSFSLSQITDKVMFCAVKEVAFVVVL